MAAATSSAEDRSSASQPARSSASQQALSVGSEALLEIGLILLGLASLAAALSGASLMAAVLVTVAAAAFVGRVLLLPRVSGSGWLGSSGGARALLVLATAAGFNNGGSLTGGEVAALVAFLGAVGLIVLEPHLDRLTGARLTVVAHLPGVDPVPTLPDRSRVVVLGGVLSTVVGAWSAVLGLPGWLWLGLVVLAAAPVLAWGLAGRRRVAAGIRLEEQLDKAVADYAPEYIVYTARPDDASYQVLMWLPYLQRAGRRFIIVTREAVPAAALAAQTDVPVIQRRRLSDLDTVVTPATRAAFYVNASSGNGALVRYHQLTHIYLGHGDSDKPPSYNPKIDPAQFSSKITHPYLLWRPGAMWVYTGTKDGQPERVEVSVKRQTKTILGVPCVVVSDIVTSNNTLTEKTTDWYAQDKAGNVWYFGEDTAEYQNGVVTTTQGTWEAGVDNAKPGIVLHAHSRVGQFYRQEFRPGVAEDKARVLTVTGTQKVPAGTFNNIVETRDINPLDPSKVENKWFAKGVGPIRVVRIRSMHHEETKLVRHTG